eukprot:COSAG01_NODE_9396_length_2456_cov_11.942300_2_plen_57_part_00
MVGGGGAGDVLRQQVGSVRAQQLPTVYCRALWLTAPCRRAAAMLLLLPPQHTAVAS